jgi:hypothetical protein
LPIAVAKRDHPVTVCEGPAEACSGLSFIWKIYTDARWSGVRGDANVAGLVLGYFQSLLREEYLSR